MKNSLFCLMNSVVFILSVPAYGQNQAVLQLSLANPIQLIDESRSITGASLGLIYTVNANVTGYDWGMVNKIPGDMMGLQEGFVNLVGEGLLAYRMVF